MLFRVLGTVIVALASAYASSAIAQSSPASKLLVGTQATLMDVGLLRIETKLTGKIFINSLARSLDARPLVSWDPAKNEISIGQMVFTEKGDAEATKRKDICRETIFSLRTWLGFDPVTGQLRKPAVETVSDLFFHRGYTSTSKEFAGDLYRIIRLKAIVYPPAEKDGTMNGMLCEAPLEGVQVLFQE